MKITLKKNPEQLELVKAMASKDRDTAFKAQSSLAAAMSRTLGEVLQVAPGLSRLFTRQEYNSEESPSIPLDIYYDVSAEDYVKVWSTVTSGGLASNQVIPLDSELRVHDYDLTTAISFDKKYAARGSVDVVGKSMTRALAEVLLKKDLTSAKLILGALAAASTNGKAHVQRVTSAGTLIPKDVNALRTLAKRISPAWNGGTPVGKARGFTDFLISPELAERILDMAYNPVNTSVGPAAGATTGVTLPESERLKLFQSSGVMEFMGVNFSEHYELGVGQKWNSIFDNLAGSTTYYKADGASGGAEFAGSTTEIAIGIDRSREGLIQLVAIDQEVGSEMVMQVDDQFAIRTNKIGFFGSAKEGRVILDDRALVGLIV